MARSSQHYARYTLAAVKLLGTLIEIERKEKRMTALDLSGRLGVNRETLSRLEKGDPKVELGTAFEACAILGIPLFEEDASGLTLRLDEAVKRRSLLPARIRTKRLKISDEF